MRIRIQLPKLNTDSNPDPQPCFHTVQISQSLNQEAHRFEPNVFLQRAVLEPEGVGTNSTTSPPSRLHRRPLTALSPPPPLQLKAVPPAPSAVHQVSTFPKIFFSSHAFGFPLSCFSLLFFLCFSILFVPSLFLFFLLF
jgi:hypothetical protein